jgi:YggT family protein
MLLRIIDVYSLVVLIAVIVSWLRLEPDNPVARVTRALTEPLLGPIRRLVPPISGLDLSPMILLLGLQLLRRLLF